MRENVSWDSAVASVGHVCKNLGAGSRPLASIRHRGPHKCVRIFALCILPQPSSANGSAACLVARCGAWVLWSTPARYRAARSVLRGGNGERFTAVREKTSRRAHQRVGISSSHQWGPLAFTVCNKHSFQRGSSNGFNGDFGSSGKRAFCIAALGAFGHEVQCARGCSIFHPFISVSLNRPQSGRWYQSPWPRVSTRRHGQGAQEANLCLTV